MLAIIIVAGSICALIAFVSNKLFSTTSEIPTLTIAVVTEDEDNSILSMAKDVFDSMLGSAGNFFLSSANDKEAGSKLVNNLAGTSDNVIFVILDEDEALRKIKNDELSAVLYLGKEEIQSIMNCTNMPIKIIIHDDNEIIPVIFREMTNSGGKLLSTSQAGTFTTTDIYGMVNRNELLSDAYDHVDIMNYTYTLYRNNMYEYESATLNGSDSIILFIGGSILTFMLLLMLSAFAPSLSDENVAFRDMLKCRSIGSIKTTLIRFISFFMINTVILLVLCFAGELIFNHYKNDITDISMFAELSISVKASALAILLISLLSSAYTIFLMSLTRHSEESVLFFFIVGSILMLLSGCIIPASFFPASLRTLSLKLPALNFQKLFIEFLKGNTLKNTSLIFYNLICSFIFLIAASVINYFKNKNSRI